VYEVPPLGLPAETAYAHSTRSYRACKPLNTSILRARPDDLLISPAGTTTRPLGSSESVLLGDRLDGVAARRRQHHHRTAPIS